MYIGCIVECQRSTVLADDLGPFPGVVPLYVGEGASDLARLLRRTLPAGAAEDQGSQG